MKASTYEVTIPQGATWELLVEWFDADGDPMDLTGADARMVVKAGNTVLFERTSPEHITLSAGQVLLRATAAETAALDWSAVRMTPRWDLLVRLASGRVAQLVKGTAVLDPSPTRTIP